MVHQHLSLDPPFSKRQALRKKSSGQLSILGYIWRADDDDSRCSSQSSITKDREAGIWLEKELSTSVLDEIHPHLWWITKEESSNIDPLHRQFIKGRKLLISEDTALHMIWTRDRIFLKPPPLYALDYIFWQQVIAVDPKRRALVCGVLRSWSYLVRFPSDLKIAQEHGFLDHHIVWDDWCSFIECFGNVQDKDVAIRYHFGQIRLLRLNWLIRIIRPPSAAGIWYYEMPYWSISAFVQHSLSPLLFTFASISVVLSAMQVLVSGAGNINATSGLTAQGSATMQDVGTIVGHLGSIPYRSVCWIASTTFMGRSEAFLTP